MNKKDKQNQSQMNLGIPKDIDEVSEKQEAPASKEENNKEKVIEKQEAPASKEENFYIVTNSFNLMYYLNWGFITSINSFYTSAVKNNDKREISSNYINDLLKLSDNVSKGHLSEIVIFTEKPHKSIIDFISDNIDKDKDIFPVVIEINEPRFKDKDRWIEGNHQEIIDFDKYNFFLHSGEPISLNQIKKIYLPDQDKLSKFEFSLKPFGNFDHYSKLFAHDSSYFNGNTINFAELKPILNNVQTIAGFTDFDDVQYLTKLNKFHGAITFSLISKNYLDEIEKIPNFDNLEKYFSFLNTNLDDPKNFNDVPGSFSWHDIHLLDEVHNMDLISKNTKNWEIDALYFLIITRYLMEIEEKEFTPKEAISKVRSDFNKYFPEHKSVEQDKWFIELNGLIENQIEIEKIEITNSIPTLEAFKLLLLRRNKLQDNEWIQWATSLNCDDEIIRITLIYGGLLIRNKVPSNLRNLNLEDIIISFKSRVLPALYQDHPLWDASGIIPEFKEDVVDKDGQIDEGATEEAEEEWRDQNTAPWPFQNNKILKKLEKNINEKCISEIVITGVEGSGKLLTSSMQKIQSFSNLKLINFQSSEKLMSEFTNFISELSKDRKLLKTKINLTDAFLISYTVDSISDLKVVDGKIEIIIPKNSKQITLIDFEKLVPLLENLSSEDWFKEKYLTKLNKMIYFNSI